MQRGRPRVEARAVGNVRLNEWRARECMARLHDAIAALTNALVAPLGTTAVERIDRELKAARQIIGKQPYPEPTRKRRGRKEPAR